MSSEVPKVTVSHEALKPLSWLVGRWRAKKAHAFYPTMDDLYYSEEMEFIETGQPNLQYKSTAWHPEKQNLMHLESGFLKIMPDTSKLALLIAHNFGVTEISEGNVMENELKLESISITKSSLKGFKVAKIQRHYVLKGDTIELLMRMATETQPMQDHLIAVYEKILK